MAKPTATGVNELRPPDAIAAQPAAAHEQPRRRPTPKFRPPRVGLEQYNPACHPDAEEQAHSAEHNPGRGPQTEPSASVMANSANTGRTIAVAVQQARYPVRSRSALGSTREGRESGLQW